MKRDVHTFLLHVCSLKKQNHRFDHPRALQDVKTPRDFWVPLEWLDSSGNAFNSLEVPSCVLLLCTCSALHTTSPQSLQCQLISTQISYSLSALSLQKLLLYTFTANKCALVDYALFARSKEKANVTLKVIHQGIVL